MKTAREWAKELHSAVHAGDNAHLTQSEAVEIAVLLEAGARDGERLDWLDMYFDLRISSTTESGQIVKHIECVAGSAMYSRGHTLRDAIDAAQKEAHSGT